MDACDFREPGIDVGPTRRGVRRVMRRRRCGRGPAAAERRGDAEAERDGLAGDAHCGVHCGLPLKSPCTNAI